MMNHAPPPHPRDEAAFATLLKDCEVLGAKLANHQLAASGSSAVHAVSECDREIARLLLRDAGRDLLFHSQRIEARASQERLSVTVVGSDCPTRSKFVNCVFQQRVLPEECDHAIAFVRHHHTCAETHTVRMFPYGGIKPIANGSASVLECLRSSSSELGTLDRLCIEAPMVSLVEMDADNANIAGVTDWISLPLISASEADADLVPRLLKAADVCVIALNSDDDDAIREDFWTRLALVQPNLIANLGDRDLAKNRTFIVVFVDDEVVDDEQRRGTEAQAIVDSMRLSLPNTPLPVKERILFLTADVPFLKGSQSPSSSENGADVESKEDEVDRVELEEKQPTAAVDRQGDAALDQPQHRPDESIVTSLKPIADHLKRVVWPARVNAIVDSQVTKALSTIQRLGSVRILCDALTTCLTYAANNELDDDEDVDAIFEHWRRMATDCESKANEFVQDVFDPWAALVNESVRAECVDALHRLIAATSEDPPKLKSSTLCAQMMLDVNFRVRAVLAQAYVQFNDLYLDFVKAISPVKPPDHQSEEESREAWSEEEEEEKVHWEERTFQMVLERFLITGRGTCCSQTDGDLHRGPFSFEMLLDPNELVEFISFRVLQSLAAESVATSQAPSNDTYEEGSSFPKRQRVPFLGYVQQGRPVSVRGDLTQLKTILSGDQTTKDTAEYHFEFMREWKSKLLLEPIGLLKQVCCAIQQCADEHPLPQAQAKKRRRRSSRTKSRSAPSDEITIGERLPFLGNIDQTAEAFAEGLHDAIEAMTM